MNAEFQFHTCLLAYLGDPAVQPFDHPYTIVRMTDIFLCWIRREVEEKRTPVIKVRFLRTANDELCFCQETIKERLIRVFSGLKTKTLPHVYATVDIERRSCNWQR
jgi:hypothetical protein